MQYIEMITSLRLSTLKVQVSCLQNVTHELPNATKVLHEIMQYKQEAIKILSNINND